MPTMAQSAAATGGAILRFLVWWREELRGLVPQGVRGRKAARIIIDIGQDGYRVFESIGGKLRPAGGNLSPLAAVALASDRARSNPSALIGIRVPLTSCFVRSLELPRNAQEDAGRILDLDLERATPFKRTDVYCATLLEDGPNRGPRVRARHLMIKRQSVEPILGELNAAGAPVDFIDSWDEANRQPLPVNFLASQQQTDSSTGRGLSVTTMLLALLALLGLSAILIANSRYQTALETVKGQVAQARGQATSVRRALDTSEAALTEILPDTVWLTDLRLENGQLDITGLAKSGAALLPLFAHSPLFADAALASAVNFDPQENKERFSLRVRVRQQGDEASASQEKK
jgi:general secretion pathway protein L